MRVWLISAVLVGALVSGIIGISIGLTGIHIYRDHLLVHEIVRALTSQQPAPAETNNE